MEQHSGDFSVTVRDVRQLNQTEGDLLTLLWVLEGSVNLTEAEGVPQPLAADELAIVNRNRRWSLRSAGTNAVMILTLSASWLTRLDSAFFAVDYQITPRTRDAEDGLRRLMRQLLVSGLVKHPSHYRLEANRWLSEIALLLATRFSQPIASTPRRGAENWSRRIASVVARIDANYQRRLSLQEVAAAEFVSEAWLSRLFHKEVGVSFVQYLTAPRLRHAADQLLTTRTPAQQIAREQGFASTRMNSIPGSLPDRVRRRPTAGSRSLSTGSMLASMNRNHATGKVPRCRSIRRRPGRSTCTIARRAPLCCAIPGWW